MRRQHDFEPRGSAQRDARAVLEENRCADGDERPECPAEDRVARTDVRPGRRADDSAELGLQVHLSNCSTTPAAFSNPRIEGESATEFAIVQQPAGTTVDANGKASWLIVLTASTPGLKRAEFVVDHDGGTARVPLDGEGLGADVGGTGDGPTEELSYYSCAATRGSSGAWALLVVVMGIVLRRRRRR